MKEHERNSSFELLRILLMLFIVILHYNNTEMGGALKYTSGINKAFIKLIESFSICAVNCFIMISGYFMVNSLERKLTKIFELFFKVIFYGIAMYLLSIILMGIDFNWRSLLSRFIPQNYYVTLYCVLFICSLFYNFFLYRLNDEWINKLIIILIILFTIWPTITDCLQDLLRLELIGISPISAYGNDEGYTLIQFSLMYFLGAFIRKNKTSFTNNGRKYLAIYILLAIFIWGMSYKFETAWNYCNIFVVLESVALFIVFMNLKLHNAVINRIAKHTFGVYLLHTSPIMMNGFWGLMDITQYAQKGGGYLLLNLIISVGSMYLICTVLDMILEKSIIPFYTFLNKIPFVNYRLNFSDVIDQSDFGQEK